MISLTERQKACFDFIKGFSDEHGFSPSFTEIASALGLSSRGRVSVSRAALASFEASAGPRDGWKFDDRQEWNRLNTVVLGLEGQRASMVAEYNARTQMANRKIFRTSDLPERL